MHIPDCLCKPCYDTTGALHRGDFKKVDNIILLGQPGVIVREKKRTGRQLDFNPVMSEHNLPGHFSESETASKSSYP